MFPDVFAMARMIATARLVLPRSMVRLSAGRMSFSPIEQSVMFLAGANSIFVGEKLGKISDAISYNEKTKTVKSGEGA